MVTFNLIYADDEFGPARRVEFEAVDAHGALVIAQNQAVGRTAELWEGGRRLCTLKRTGEDGAIWEIGPGAEARSPASPPPMALAIKDAQPAGGIAEQ